MTTSIPSWEKIMNWLKLFNTSAQGEVEWKAKAELASKTSNEVLCV